MFTRLTPIIIAAALAFTAKSETSSGHTSGSPLKDATVVLTQSDILRHWILCIAFIGGVVLTVSNIVQNYRDQKHSADYRSLNREYNVAMLILFAALAYEQISALLAH